MSINLFGNRPFEDLSARQTHSFKFWMLDKPTLVSRKSISLFDDLRNLKIVSVIKVSN